MNDFLDFNFSFDYCNDNETISRIIDRLLFYDCGSENGLLLDDLRYLRMLFYYYISPEKEKLSFDDELKTAFANTVTRTINAIKESDETDTYITTDLQELLVMENAVFEILA